jgi:hypothetical protein
MFKAVRVDIESTKLTAIDGTSQVSTDSGFESDKWRFSFFSLLLGIGLLYGV